MPSLRTKHSTTRFVRCLLILFAAGTLVHAQAPSVEHVSADVLRMEGTDGESGIHYVRLILLLNAPHASGTTADAETAPRFTMECREKAGNRSLHWLVRFDGSSDFDFQRPKVSTKEDLYPIQNPNVDLKMRFEGYMRSQEFKRQWEVYPTGELHYRNAGFGSANMDDPHYFLQWLNALPNIRIGYAKAGHAPPTELVFPLQPILTELKKSELCPR